MKSLSCGKAWCDPFESVSNRHVSSRNSQKGRRLSPVIRLSLSRVTLADPATPTGREDRGKGGAQVVVGLEHKQSVVDVIVEYSIGGCIAVVLRHLTADDNAPSGTKGREIIACPKSGQDAVMAMGSVNDVVNSPVCSDAEVEAFTGIDTTKTVEETTGECGLCVGTGSVEQQDGDEPWVFDMGATQRFSPDCSKMAEDRECGDSVLRCAGGSTYPIVGRGNLTLGF